MANKEHGILTENLKKGLTEYLLLQCLAARPMAIYEIVAVLDEKSGGICRICYPYATIYRLLDAGCIAEMGKHFADNRRRAFYRITDIGKVHLAQMKSELNAFLLGVSKIETYLEGEDDDGEQHSQEVS